MKLEEINDCYIAEHWAVAIEYGEYDALSEEEIETLKNWLSDYHNCCFVWSGSTEFHKDEISGLLGMCQLVTILKPIKE